MLFTDLFKKLILGLLLLLPGLVLAADGVPLPNLLKFDDIPGLIRGIINFFELLAMPVAVFFIVYAGFKYVTAQGNQSEIKKANEILLWTAIGIGVIFAAEAIIVAVQKIISELGR